ncbi:hypothetical protein Nepgr_030432 [Nepenthes gracilis]|uniref:Uncharacterized protein n=1 Tax=Nepenthes gracilis TaxID=150966 RepID=A0AAD3Y624_NEPGR|nr:hypothetical protein Nepgr_030432 [Nepenthes gracilis]
MAVLVGASEAPWPTCLATCELFGDKPKFGVRPLEGLKFEYDRLRASWHGAKVFGPLRALRREAEVRVQLCEGRLARSQGFSLQADEDLLNSGAI